MKGESAPSSTRASGVVAPKSAAATSAVSAGLNRLLMKRHLLLHCEKRGRFVGHGHDIVAVERRFRRDQRVDLAIDLGALGGGQRGDEATPAADGTCDSSIEL